MDNDGEGTTAVDDFPEMVREAVLARPGKGAMVWRRMFSDRPEECPRARRLVRLLMEDTERADDAEWIVAELFSNGLRHTRSSRPHGALVVELIRTRASARVAVYDMGGNGTPQISQNEPDDMDQHGRGLLGISQLAARVSFRGDPVRGHVVWAQLSLAERRAS